MLRKIGLIFLIAVLGVLLVLGLRAFEYWFLDGLNPFLGSIFVLVMLPVLIVLTVFIFRRMRMREGFGPGDWFWVVSLGWLLEGIWRWSQKETFDIQLHDTYFVIANLQLFTGMAVLFGLLAVIYTVYPLIVGKPLRYILGMIHFWICFFGAIFFIFYGAIYWSGMPRRYLDIEPGGDFRNSYMFVDGTVGVVLLIVLFAQVLFLVNLVYSAFAHRKSAD